MSGHPRRAGSADPVRSRRRRGQARMDLNTREAPPCWAAPLVSCGADSAGLAVRRVIVALRAVLLELQPVRVVTTVLARDVVAVLTLHASHGDLRTDVGGGHGGVPLSYGDLNRSTCSLPGRARARRSRTTRGPTDQ